MDPSATFEMYDYILKTKNKHLTLADLKKLQPGDCLDVVIWDRNWEEAWAWTKAGDQVPYPSEEFLVHNRHQITYKGDMLWDIHFNYGETLTYPVHLNTEGLSKTYWKWCDISPEDGKIHITNEYLPRGQEKIPDDWCAQHIHWSEFPDNTRIGWRGPMMLWSNVIGNGRIYLKKGYYGEEG